MRTPLSQARGWIDSVHTDRQQNKKDTRLSVCDPYEEACLTAIFLPDLILASRERSWSKMRTQFKMLLHFEDGSMSVRNHSKTKKALQVECFRFAGDPYGNRTHVTAVKGPCLNRLTNGPYYGGGNGI